MSGRHVIVVGAGIAGLVAARRLAQAGHSVRVFEASGVPGGRVGERELRGIRFNAGARLVYPFSRPFNALLDEIGLAAALDPVRHLSAECIGPHGSWTVELMPGIKSLLTPGLTWRERLRFLAFGLGAIAARRRTDPDDAASAAAEDGTTLASHISRVLGPGVLERIVEPVFRGTRSWDSRGVSAAFFASTTPHLLGLRAVHVFRGGMARLPDALAAGLAVNCGARVTMVEAEGAGSCRVHAVRNGAETVDEADLVVCATEGSLAADLIPGLGNAERAFFAGVRYNSLGIVHYRLNRQVEPAMKFFTRDASGPLATWQQLPGDDATGQPPQLYAQLSPEAVATAIERGMTTRLDELVAERVRMLHPAIGEDCVDLHNQWIARMLPVFHPGYARAVDAFRERQSSTRRRVYFCGDYLAQALVTGAAASGERAARDIVRHWGRA